ncbi:protein kinase domain-containing protein [Citrus sinensis]|uniref:Protein kinase domain-containing protein n=1 Tax=Citrus sinensis TaxID=2711 RepID=A0ACB8M591_CITSI|nr:protein kinase domain-containing protein [Citrus sinensis]
MDAVFLSIDCGSSESYTDENGIEWTGDDAYIQNGDNKTVAYPSLVPYPMSTMRVFSTRKKNCYSFKVDEGERVLVRASFYYGNYDRKNSPPVFDLQFDGNFWTTVNTSLRSYDVLSYEAIYVVKRNFTSICVAQTKPGQLPFISAIEVRSLGINMYSQVPSNLALHLIQRAAMGANQTIIRYPDDAYDRTWNGAYGFGLSEVASQALSINITTNNSPPTAALKNAVVSASTSHIIILFTDLPAKPTPVYIATYFSEVLLLNPTQKRSFQLCIDDKPISDPIIPPFASASEAYVTNRIASASNSFSLRATSDSTLPPLVNAMEIYTVSNPLTNGTNVKDVEGLAVLQSGLKVLQEWSGDPCLPSPYTWDWVQCSSDLIPRITALDLSDNSFSGNIPEFLGTLPNLTLLNLAGNRFNGTIPTKLSSNKQLKLVVTGNCLNGMSCPHQSPPPLPKEAPSPSSPTDRE